jgi:hypothetical protein
MARFIHGLSTTFHQHRPQSFSPFFRLAHDSWPVMSMSA